VANRHLKTYGPGFTWNGKTIIDLYYADGSRPTITAGLNEEGQPVGIPYGKNERLRILWSDGSETDSSIIPTDQNRERIMQGKQPIVNYEEGW
jgi:hypothetical protein